MNSWGSREERECQVGQKGTLNHHLEVLTRMTKQTLLSGEFFLILNFPLYFNAAVCLFWKHGQFHSHKLRVQDYLYKSSKTKIPQWPLEVTNTILREVVIF